MGRMHRAINPADTGGPQEGPNRKTRCPRCGDSFGNLPKHMRACDGGPLDE